MTYNAKDYSGLLGMKGFSEALLKNHFTLYQGYVTNTNKVLDTIEKMVQENRISTPEFAELKRRLGWEFNGMRLHEFYFENIGGDGRLEPSSKLYKQLEKDFGSFEKWIAEFKATGSMRGIGWVALYQDTQTNRLINFWINEHDVSHPAGCDLILIMDVFEHAFMLDYGLKRADYIEAFFNNVNWREVEKRFKSTSN